MRVPRIDDFLDPSFSVDSWRTDAEVDEPTTATARRPIELSPGVWIYPEFLERLERNRADPYHPSNAWKLEEF